MPEDIETQLKREVEDLRRQAAQWTSVNAALNQRISDLMARNSELERVNQELRSQAGTDSMTNIANFRAFRQQLDMAFHHARRHSTPLSLLLLDVDKFKQFNDTFGHPAGDEVLRQVARRLRQQVRMFDFVARYGGEEFVIILPGADAQGAAAQAERLRGLIAQIKFDTQQLTASIGVATVTAETYRPDDLIQHADIALYAAKRAGRNTVCRYDLLSDRDKTQYQRTSPLLPEMTVPLPPFGKS